MINRNAVLFPVVLVLSLTPVALNAQQSQEFSCQSISDESKILATVESELKSADAAVLTVPPEEWAYLDSEAPFTFTNGVRASSVKSRPLYGAYEARKAMKSVEAELKVLRSIGLASVKSIVPLVNLRDKLKFLTLTLTAQDVQNFWYPDAVATGDPPRSILLFVRADDTLRSCIKMIVDAAVLQKDSRRKSMQ